MFNRFRKRETRAVKVDPSWQALGALSARGAVTTARQAEQLSTVSACVSLISSSIASLPAYVYAESEGGRAIQSRHSLARLVKGGVNEHQTWACFIESLIASTLLTGNGIAIIERNTRGELIGLRFVPWSCVTVVALPNGRIAYDIQNDSTLGAIWPKGRYLSGEVLHLRDRSDNGVIGVSRLRRAAAVLEMGITVNEFAQTWFDRGMNPSGVIESEMGVGRDTIKRIKDAYEKAYAGISQAGRLMILDGGLKWKPNQATAEDGELLTSRKFTTEEICRIFQVSPIMVADLSHGTFTNSIEMFKQFVRLCLAGWIEKLKAEFSRSVFAGDEVFTHSLDFDLSSFMKADDLARWQSHKIAVEASILTQNEVREVEGWNSLPIVQSSLMS